MDESFPAYLEQVRRQRAELGESMAALEAALTLPAGAGPVWRRRVRAAGLTRVGLLGTAFTMASPSYRQRFTAAGVDLLVPGQVARDLVHAVIFEELCVGVVSDTSRVQLQAAITDLVADGAQGVVLGCTELELLLGQDDAAVPLFPTTALHVAAALDVAMAPGA